MKKIFGLLLFTVITSSAFADVVMTGRTYSGPVAIEGNITGEGLLINRPNLDEGADAAISNSMVITNATGQARFGMFPQAGQNASISFCDEGSILSGPGTCAGSDAIIYEASTDNIYFNVNGVEHFRVTTIGAEVRNAGADVYLDVINDGTAGNDSFIRMGTGGTPDAYRIVADNDAGMTFRVNSSNILTLNGGVGSIATMNNILRMPPGATNNPTIHSTNDFDTGIYFPAAAQVGISIGNNLEHVFAANTYQLNGSSMNIVSTGDAIMSIRAEGSGSNDSFLYMGDDADEDRGYIMYDHSAEDFLFRAGGGVFSASVDALGVTLLNGTKINNIEGAATLAQNAESTGIFNILEGQIWQCGASFRGGTNSGTRCFAYVQRRTSGTTVIVDHIIQNGCNFNLGSSASGRMDFQKTASGSTSMGWYCTRMR